MSLRDVGTVKDTTTITLYHPATGKDLLNADKTPMTVVIHGPYSERYKSVLRDQQQRRMTDISRNSRGAVTMDPEELDAMTRELTARCIEDWSITLEGDEKLPFSRDAVDAVFSEFPWVRDQITAAMGNVADFLDTPKKH
jgi:hypothetical protein